MLRIEPRRAASKDLALRQRAIDRRAGGSPTRHLEPFDVPPFFVAADGQAAQVGSDRRREITGDAGLIEGAFIALRQRVVIGVVPLKRSRIGLRQLRTCPLLDLGCRRANRTTHGDRPQFPVLLVDLQNRRQLLQREIGRAVVTMCSEEAAFVVAVSDQAISELAVLVAGMNGPRFPLVVHEHAHHPAVLRTDPQHVRVVAVGRCMRSPALPAIPLADDGTIRRKVSGAARSTGRFGDIEAAAAICTEIGEAREAALGGVVIEPVLATTFRAVCSFQYPIDREPFDLLRARFIHEQFAG